MAASVSHRTQRQAKRSRSGRRLYPPPTPPRQPTHLSTPTYLPPRAAFVPRFLSCQTSFVSQPCSPSRRQLSNIPPRAAVKLHKASYVPWLPSCNRAISLCGTANVRQTLPSCTVKLSKKHAQKNRESRNPHICVALTRLTWHQTRWEIHLAPNRVA